MLDLLAIANPLEPIKLRNGRVLEARPLDAAGWELYRRARETGSEDAGVAVLRHILPDLTTDDIECIGVRDVEAIIAYAADRINMALVTLGNSPGTAAATPAPPSSPSAIPSTS